MTVDHRRLPRRRGDALYRAIFDATLEELAKVGYRGLTMEWVAKRAGASKASLYRRWPSRAHLVADAIRDRLDSMLQSTELPDTGNLRADLLALFRVAAEWLAGPIGEAARGLLVESIRGDEHALAARTGILDSRSDLVLEVLTRAATRGDVRPEALTSRIADVGPSLLRQHFLVHGAPIPDEVITEIVDEIVLPLVSAG